MAKEQISLTPVAAFVSATIKQKPMIKRGTVCVYQYFVMIFLIGAYFPIFSLQIYTPNL